MKIAPMQGENRRSTPLPAQAKRLRSHRGYIAICKGMSNMWMKPSEMQRATQSFKKEEMEQDDFLKSS
jgi:hypothetical protein